MDRGGGGGGGRKGGKGVRGVEQGMSVTRIFTYVHAIVEEYVNYTNSCREMRQTASSGLGLPFGWAPRTRLMSQLRRWLWNGE